MEKSNIITDKKVTDEKALLQYIINDKPDQAYCLIQSIQELNLSYHTKDLSVNQIPLLAAALRGQLNVVKAILEKDSKLIDTVDKGSANILHVSVYYGRTEIIKYCFNQYKEILSDLINHYSNNGNTPLGTTFLAENKNSNLKKIEMATEFVALKEYSINSYLNTKGMDCITPSRIGGNTLLHQVISLAANIKEPIKEETIAISEFFKTLKKRNNEAEDKDLFNPDYPIMNPRPWNYESREKNLYSFTKKACFIRSEAKSQPVIKKVNDKKEPPISITPNKKTEYSVNPKTTFFLEETSATSTDFHMISTSLLLDKITFQSRKLQALCKKHFNALKRDYEVRQFEDESGDSDDSDEDTPAVQYKNMYLKFDEYIRTELGKSGNNFLVERSEPKEFQRTFDSFKHEECTVPPKIWKIVSDTNKKYDVKLWENYWDTINQPSNKPKQPAKYLSDCKDTLTTMVVPLFHGVPFMDSQYTNHQRREIAKKIFKINNKLLEKKELTAKDKVMIGIHSRTATASAGMQSLYEIMQATPEQLKNLSDIDDKIYKFFETEKNLPDYFAKAIKKARSLVVGNSKGDKKLKLEKEFWNKLKTPDGMQSLYEIVKIEEMKNKVNDKLHEYFVKENIPSASFIKAMKHYLFDFGKGETKEFWEQMMLANDSDFPDIIKYRFPVIATSKAPDHPIRFAIGRNVEGATRGETPMNPEYVDGQPTHRLAGLIYVTLHKLTDLVNARTNNMLIDINHNLELGKIYSGNIMNKNNIANQVECGFLGKIDIDSIVAVVPVVYPHIRKDKNFKPDYHKAIYGINTDADITSTVHHNKIKEDLSVSSNLSILDSKSGLSGFGKMWVPSTTALINGLITATAHSKGYFLCTINDNNELIPYKVKFDESTKGRKFSLAQKDITLPGKDDKKYTPIVQDPDIAQLDIKRFWEVEAQNLYNSEKEALAGDLSSEFTNLIFQNVDGYKLSTINLPQGQANLNANNKDLSSKIEDITSRVEKIVLTEYNASEISIVENPQSSTSEQIKEKDFELWQDAQSTWEWLNKQYKENEWPPEISARYIKLFAESQDLESNLKEGAKIAAKSSQSKSANQNNIIYDQQNAFNRRHSEKYLYQNHDILRIQQQLLNQYPEFIQCNPIQVGNDENNANTHRELVNNIENNNGPFLGVFNPTGLHWAAFCIIKNEDNTLTILYKDSFGSNADTFTKTISPLLSKCTIKEPVIFHGSTEQSDGVDCGIFALKNMRIMAEQLSNVQTKQQFIEKFQEHRFCSLSEAKKLRENDFANLYKKQVQLDVTDTFINSELRQKIAKHHHEELTPLSAQLTAKSSKNNLLKDISFRVVEGNKDPASILKNNENIVCIEISNIKVGTLGDNDTSPYKYNYNLCLSKNLTTNKSVIANFIKNTLGADAVEDLRGGDFIRYQLNPSEITGSKAKSCLELTDAKKDIEESLYDDSSVLHKKLQEQLSLAQIEENNIPAGNQDVIDSVSQGDKSVQQEITDLLAQYQNGYWQDNCPPEICQLFGILTNLLDYSNNVSPYHHDAQ